MASRVITRICLAGLVLLAAAVGGTAQVGPSPEAMLTDVQSMEVDSNPGRRESLMAILDAHGIGFELETFEVEATRRAPATTGTNIVVSIGAGTRDIVIGAHFDAVTLGGGALSRGAVDNAASSIILTRLAEALQSEALNHRIRIVFFDLEEIGLRGSQSYVETHGVDSIDAAINMDVNGYGDTLFFGPTLDANSRWLSDLMSESCEQQDLGCLRFGQYPASDHMSFQRAGVPSISFSILPEDQAQELWIAENGTREQRAGLEGLPTVLALIHTSEDNSSHIDPAGMLITYQAVLNLVRKLDSIGD